MDVEVDSDGILCPRGNAKPMKPGTPLEDNFPGAVDGMTLHFFVFADADSSDVEFLDSFLDSFHETSAIKFLDISPISSQTGFLNASPISCDLGFLDASHDSSDTALLDASHDSSDSGLLVASPATTLFLIPAIIASSSSLLLPPLEMIDHPGKIERT